MLKDDKIIHEERPEGKIVGGNVFEFDNSTKELENAVDTAPVQETPVMEEAPVETVAVEATTEWF